MKRNQAISIAKQAYSFYLTHARVESKIGVYTARVCNTDNHGSYVVVEGPGAVIRCPVRKSWGL